MTTLEKNLYRWTFQFEVHKTYSFEVIAIASNHTAAIKKATAVAKETLIRVGSIKLVRIEEL